MADVIISASYRKDSLSLKLAQSLYGDFEVVRLEDYTVEYCHGCGGCDKSGKCVIADDHSALLQKIDAAENITLAFPIYFDSVPAQLKAVIDRMQQRYITTYGVGGKIEKTKTLNVVFTAGGKAVVPAYKTVKYFADCIGAKLGRCTGLAFTDSNPPLSDAQELSFT